jgi:uncharacterized protein YdaU (DUF1376 family)
MPRSVDTYIPLFGRDFYASTATWTAAEVGHYIRLLIIQWDSGGLPEPLERLEIVSPGVGECWAVLEDKFPVWGDGLRRNRRMEEHREKACELKDARAKAGRNGNSSRWGDRKKIANGSQTDRKAIANGIANGIAKVSPPSPSPSPSPSPNTSSSPSSSSRGEEEQNTTRAAFGREAGWAAEEWERFLAVWNRTQRAKPWTALTAPSGWVDLAASPGWLGRAHEAAGRLPACEYFSDPVAITRFFEYVDRILAGEFDNAKQRQARRQPAGGNL